jgi:isoquinoline 1-oxidoreductase alpha subunit
MTVTLTVNGQSRTVDAAEDTPLLWVLREELALVGTKFGCGLGLCGACTVHLDGAAVRSCQTPLGYAAGKRVTTIEGLSEASGSGALHPVQKAWVAESVPQCGYCQSGQIMSAVALLARTPRPSDDEIDAFMSGNICRCGAYQGIRRAIHRAAGDSQSDGGRR